MRLSDVVDFYMLQSLSYHMGQEAALSSEFLVRKYFKDSTASIMLAGDPENISKMTRLALRVESLQAHVTSIVSIAFRDYCFLASCGEARHVDGCSTGSAPEDLPRDNFSRSASIEYALNYDPMENASVLERVFNQSWISSYGGRNWAQIAAAVKLYGIDKAILVDHVVDLKHNGGCLFNKSSALYRSDIELDISESTLMNFLDYKRDNDILRLHPHYQQFLSEEVAVLVNEYFRLRKINFRVKGKKAGGFNHNPPTFKNKVFSDNWVRRASVLICPNCNRSVPEDDSHDGYCEDCYNEIYTHCDCGHTVRDNDYEVVKSGLVICNSCIGWNYARCENCYEYEHDSNTSSGGDGIIYCNECWEGAPFCAHCDEEKIFNTTYVPHAGFKPLCDACKPEFQAKHGYYTEQMTLITG
jgi:hypothetical protein